MNNDLFQAYESLVAKAESSFQGMEKEYGDCIKCKIQCSDCCHSIFGLFSIESAYLSHHFSRLDRKLRREILSRCEKTDRELLELEKRLKEAHGEDQQALLSAIARERVRCPLLNDENKCSMYQHRPITCRVYGMPTVIGGKMHACWKAGFERGKQYPAFDLDGMYRELYGLSKEFLARAGNMDEERASLLLSVSKSVSTPLEELT
ncbi:glutamate synthase large chain [Desulfocucumis palustris]|uniref:Glutamate synthase large chain n=1 Tax=Desulfocucumis palustris TaxID=1898651 RepID=A0A2L2XJ10_9FIRM|nr:YkgJ family cysteine cluster protein [Desulfocucumis palustris]GBF35693.1 glutamate synthase large chain [Desulfocucumis palustris]